MREPRGLGGRGGGRGEGGGEGGGGGGAGRQRRRRRSPALRAQEFATLSAGFPSGPEGPAQRPRSTETPAAAARAAPPAAAREKLPEPACLPGSQRRREARLPGTVGARPGGAAPARSEVRGHRSWERGTSGRNTCAWLSVLVTCLLTPRTRGAGRDARVRHGARLRSAGTRGVGARGGESCALWVLPPRGIGPADHCSQTAGGLPEPLAKGED